MSLLATASPWDSSESTPNKKRIPSMNVPNRRTVKNRDSTESDEGFQEMNPAYLGGQIAGQPLSIEETKRAQDSNSLKINGLLNKITGFDSENGRLADFKPPPNPALTKSPQQPMSQDNPLIPALPKSRDPGTGAMYYRPYTTTNTAEFSNYLDAHANTISYKSSQKDQGVPYYAKKDDRINYIVHMLEEMQKEKTSHVTEEFILYTMLGVFIIYIVDGFARIGTRYVR